MKKLILAASVAFAGMVGLNAQSMEALQLGARAGYNYSTITSDMDTEGLSGFHVGLFTEIPVSEKFSIQPEVIYSTQGAKLEDYDVELKTQNINVPILAKFYLAEGFNLQLGPQVSFNTDADWEINDNTYDFDEDDALSSVNFGAVVGAGYKVYEGFTVDARYNFGLTNVLDDDIVDEVSFIDDNDFKNGVFSIGIGYQF